MGRSIDLLTLKIANGVVVSERVSDKSVVPNSAIKASKELAKKILDVMPPKIKRLYIKNNEELFKYTITYEKSGEYTISIKTAEAIQSLFSNELDDICEMINIALNS